MRLRNPIQPLLAAGDTALTFAVRSELQKSHERADSLWDLPAVRRLLRRQQRDGSWRYPSRASRIRAAETYEQLETYDTLLQLVERYRLDVQHPAIPKAADFLLSFQTDEGDLRGIYGNQYTPNYTAAILAVLIDAGYRSDPRVDRGLRWLLAMRQDDGGWAIPLRTGRLLTLKAAMRIHAAIAPDRAKPSSHLVTGIVLRALAAHPRFRRRAETKRAAALLATRFFMPDPYPDRKAASYWTKFAFPFRWTDLVSALDAIGLTGRGAEDPHVADGLAWLARHQGRDGLWRSGYRKTRDPLVDHWVTFAVARAFRRVSGDRDDAWLDDPVSATRDRSA
jgi:hypothetical protein